MHFAYLPRILQSIKTHQAHTDLETRYDRELLFPKWLALFTMH